MGNLTLCFNQEMPANKGTSKPFVGKKRLQMKSSRVLYFDVLNVISCISVVCMHSNGYVHRFVKDDWWWLRVLIEVICFFAVPVFFMLSGANLLGYRERYSTAIFYRKRLLKTLIPFLIWGVLFYGLYWFVGGGIPEWKEILENFAKGTIPYTNYWFFIPLFLLYLFIPFLSLIIISISQRLMIFFILLLILFQSVLPMLFSITDLKIDFSMPISGYVVYALLGYYIAQSNIEKNNKFLYVVGLFAIVSLLIRYYLLYCSNEKDLMLFTYFGLYAIIPSVFIFILAKRYLSNGIICKRFSSLFTCLSRRSYGVYLVHTFLIVLLSKVISREDPWFIPISVFLVYTFSVILIMVLQEIKVFKFLVP